MLRSRLNVLAEDPAGFSQRCNKQFLDLSFYDLISEGDAFRVILLEPLVGDFRGCEHLEMVGMADTMVGVHVNPDHFLWSLGHHILPDALEEGVPHLALSGFRT